MTIDAGFPTKWEGRIQKMPYLPFQAKKCGTGWVKAHMIITALIIECFLKMARENITWEIRNIIQRKKGSLIQQLRNLSSCHMRGFVGSTVIGITKCGG